MKTFSEVLTDLEGLIGLPLSSISGQAAPFQITEIDREAGRVVLDVNGSRQTRRFEELQLIWEAMCALPAVSVEQVLHGSGTRRNQPETILASLPYVEVVFIDGQKNIAYVGEDTHERGTLQRMDEQKTEEYQALMSMPRPRNPLLPPIDEEEEEPIPTRETLMSLDNKAFIFSCLRIMSVRRLFNGFTLPVLESREECALQFHHNNIHGILFKRQPGMTDAEFRAAMHDDAGVSRYYTDTVSIGEDEYYVSSQWRPDREAARGEFLDWLFELLLAIRFETGLISTYERNRIVFGAPGTGKSHTLKADAQSLLSGTEGSFERVTFHPEYSYSHFVGSYKPVTNALGEIRYDFVPGPFMRVLVAALKSGRTDNPQPHLLLIEEINRAKVAAVFGEVFQLLDRSEAGSSEYEIHATEDIKKYLISELGKSPESIKIPDNMFIWATMNSADQGVYPIDTAFKRRWNFEYIGIDDNDDEVGGIVELGSAPNNRDVNWNTLRKAINETLAVTYGVNEDKLLGPYFLSRQVFAYGEDGRMLNPGKFISTFKSKVIMYLYEDAAKPMKHRLFEGCDSSKYSSVCAAFEDRGIQIFGASFVETYNALEG